MFLHTRPHVRPANLQIFDNGTFPVLQSIVTAGIIMDDTWQHDRLLYFASQFSQAVL
jgi:hypothetical protein